jgi:hypothetical protein
MPTPPTSTRATPGADVPRASAVGARGDANTSTTMPPKTTTEGARGTRGTSREGAREGAMFAATRRTRSSARARVASASVVGMM